MILKVSILTFSLMTGAIIPLAIYLVMLMASLITEWKQEQSLVKQV